MKLYFTDAFTEKKLFGNPAPVIMEAEDLTDGEKQKIAKELNTSETIFISKSKIADFRIQFFTPKVEVELCGHGTIAAYWVLACIGCIPYSAPVVQIKQETKAGVLPVDVYFNGTGKVVKIMMHQTPPVFFNDQIDKNEVARILNLDAADLMDNLPVLNVSTGRAKLLVPVKNQRILYRINPDFIRMAGFCREIKTNGFHVFTFETHRQESVTTARHFAPTAGVNEDMVTGNAAGALGCYLVKYHNSPGPLQTSYSYIMEQGFNLGRDGILFVEINSSDTEITSVKVGGKAAVLFQTEFTL